MKKERQQEGRKGKEWSYSRGRVVDDAIPGNSVTVHEEGDKKRKDVYVPCDQS